MIRSVRARLTAAVTVVVGGLAIGAALVAPHSVRNALVDDRLDAEVSRESNALQPGVAVVSLETGRRLGPPELTAVFGPQIVALTDSLDASGVLRRLRAFDEGERLLVSPVAGIVGTVRADGTVRVEEVGDESLGGPVITLTRLQELSDTVNVRPATIPYDLFGDEDMTFAELVAELDGRFGTDIGSQLDATLLEQFPSFDLGDERIPPDVFDFLHDEFGPGGTFDAAAVTSADDHLFGTRRVGSYEVIVSASAEGIDRSVERVRDALWFSVPLAMLLAGGITWLLAGRALRPVRAITEQTRRIRSSTLHERVPVPGPDDEIRALATEMNTMLARVQREDERRRQFVADASHELRSPIAAIRTQAEAALATADPAGDDHPERLLATGVLAEAERMGGLVDDLLSLARHDEELAPPGVIVDLDDIVLDEARRPRRVPVDVSRVTAGRVRGRPEELTRMVTHLLDNAARHASERIVVSLETGGDRDQTVTMTVDDDGPGVPVEHRERIFERFVRLDEARHRDGGGAGLGLAVVASVVTTAGGSVSVGESPLGGARFAVELPAAS